MTAVALDTRGRTLGTLGILALGALLTALVVAPLAAVLLRAVIDIRDGAITPTLDNLRHALGDGAYWQALGNTVVVSGGAALVAAVLGASLGWLFARTNTPYRVLLERICELPIFVPPFVGAVAWALLVAPRIGIVNRGLTATGIGWELDAYTRTGMLCIIGLYLAPYVMLLVSAALRSMDPSLEEAAQVSGLSTLGTSVRITLPLLAPAITSGLLLAFTIAIGLFGTPIVLGWSRQILLLTSRIWISSQATPPDYGTMAVLSLYLVVLSTLATFAQRAVLGGRSYVTVTGKGFRPRLNDLGRGRWGSFAAVVAYVIATILAPVAVLVAAALSSYTWSGRFAVANLVKALSSDEVWFTIRNSLVLSVASATIATVLGLGVAWLVVRTRLPGRGLVEYLVLLPISVPGIAFGVGVMLVWIAVPLPVYGTAAILVIAFVGRFSAYAVRSISANLVQVHPELEECARIFGFGPLRTLASITIPLIWPSIVAGWLLLFSFFFTELSMVIVLYTAETRTFSVLSFEVWNVGDFSRLAALSLLQLGIGLVLTATLRAIFSAPAERLS